MAAKKAKESKVPNRRFPNLRFPEFEGVWVGSSVGEIISVKCDKYNPLTDEVEYPCVELESLSQATGELVSTFNSKNQKSMKNVFRTGDVLFGKLRPYLKKYFLADFDGVCSSEIWVMKSNVLSSLYLFSFVQSKAFLSLTEISSGSKMPRADWNLVSASTVYYPRDNNERKKIGTLFDLISQRIQTQSKIIEELKSLQGALVYNLFFKSFSSNKWNAYTYNDLFTISTKKNIENAIHNILSASQAMGMVERNEIEIDIKFDEKSVRSYKIVEPGDYVIHLRSFQGGIAFSDKRGICSPAYTILRPKTLLEYSFLKEYFRSKKFIQSLKLVTYGIRDGRSISIEEFLKLKISIPSRDNQSKILAIVSAMNKKIYLNIKIQELLLKQKQYLLQNMFI